MSVRATRGAARRLAPAAAVALAVLVAAGTGLGQDRGAGPELPADLLRAAPFDRITLVDNTVVLVEPISPRPLPEYDAAKAAKEAREREERRKLGRPGRRKGARPTAEEAEAEAEARKKEEEAAEPTVALALLEGDPRDVKVKRRSIRKVDYFEDLLVAEAERLTLAADYTRAFEHLLRVRLRDPDWRTLGDAVDKLLLAEGREALGQGDEAKGLRLLRELHARRPDFAGLADQLAAAYGARADRAFEVGAYEAGRVALRELESLTPNHPTAQAAAARYVNRARDLVAKANQATGFDRLDRLAEAANVWPTLDGVEAAYREAFAAAPTLAVGVVDLPRPLTPWVHSAASARAARLAYLPILAATGEEATEGGRDDQLAAGLDRNTDLGRRLVLTLRKGPAWSDGTRPVGAIDVARALTDRAEPRSPGFDARWADLLERVVTLDDGRVEIGLARAVLNPEAWLVMPVGPAHADRDGLVPVAGKGRRVVGDGPFPDVRAVGDDRDEYRAAGEGSAADAPGPKIRRVVEVRLPDPKAMLAALARGDVALLEHVPPDRLPEVAAIPGVGVGTYAHPSLHSIALDGRNSALRNRTLRRGLAYAIDRKVLLEESLLRRAGDDRNAPSDGPFARGSYADAPDVKPLTFDPLLARMLVAAARRELGVPAIKLTFEYPATPEARAVAPKIAAMLRDAGLTIEAVERPESELEPALRAGRPFELAYRATRCAEPATEAGTLVCPGYEAPPSSGGLSALASPRILQLLLALDRAPDGPTARGLLLQVDRESRDELPLIPLWQLEDHYAWRPELRGPKESTPNLYDGVAAWEISPWLPRDPS